MSQFWLDICYSSRRLVRTPVMTSIAIVSLALGIGANTAIFSLINALILRSLPVHQPQQLVEIHTALPGHPSTGYFVNPVPFRVFEEIRKRNTVFSGVFAWDDEGLRNVRANGVQYPGSVIEVSGDYFATLGVRPLLGRLLTPQDAVPGAPAKVAVLDYRCWENHFMRDSAVVGKVIRIDNVPLTIIGVTPEGFRQIDIDAAVDAAVPIGFDTPDISNNWYKVLGRLRPSITVEQARAQLLTMWPAIQESVVPAGYGAPQRKRFLSRRPYVESAASGFSYLREEISRPLNVLMYLVAAVLLIACANLAGLMLARAAGRRNELGVRIVLGAGRWPLVRQFLIESAMLSFAGAALGFACCFWSGRFLLNMVWMGKVGVGLDVSPDLRVLAFTTAAAIFTGVAFGIVPALHATRIDPASALQQNLRTAHSGGMVLRRVLIAAQVALSLVLIFGAALLVRTLDNLQSADTGYRREGVLCVELFPQPGRERIPNRTAYFSALIESLKRIPGIEGASYSFGAPMSMSSHEFNETVSTPPSGSSTAQAATGTIGPGFFQVMGMHVLAGREFTWDDAEDAPKVAVVSESLARRLFPEQNPLGQRITVANTPGGKDLRIVGIVNSARLWRIQSHEPPAVYMAFLQSANLNQPMLDIRTARDPTAFARSAETAVESLGFHYSVKTQSLRQRLDMFLGNERILALLSGFFGTLALMLAGIGLFGLISQTVTARTAEIGIRMALGAQRGNILSLFLREAFLPVCAGIAIGLPIALIASQVISGMLFGVSPFSPTSIALPSIILMAVGVIAAYIPARRASSVEPITALRAE
jgi:predicted permease